MTPKSHTPDEDVLVPDGLYVLVADDPVAELDSGLATGAPGPVRIATVGKKVNNNQVGDPAPALRDR
jgi:hypothetical protein